MSSARFTLVVVGFTLFALLDGLVLGVIAGMVLRSPPPSAPVISTDEYVTLVSVAYAEDGDLNSARERLALLYTDGPMLATLLADVASRARADQSGAINELSLALPDQAPVQPAAKAPAPLPTFTPTLVLKLSDTPAAPPLAKGQSVALGAPATSTATRAAAPTRTRTPTPRPTATRPRPTATRTAQPIVAAPPTKTPVPPPAAPGVQYRIKLVRRLTACENGGNHHLHVLVLDAAGNGLSGKPVLFDWPSGSFVDSTGKKSEYIPFLGVTNQTTAGYVNFPMYKGTYRAKVLDGVSEQTGWLTVDIPVDEYCATNDNPQGNSTYHYSYLVVFQRAY